MWVNISAERDRFRHWRSAAREVGLGVDAWIALQIEFDLVLADLAAVTSPIRILEGALAANSVTRLGPPGQLRDWLATRDPCDIDELPELVLPERLTARLTPGAAISARLNPELVELAMACDREAALQGRTLESWALQAVLQVAGWQS